MADPAFRAELEKWTGTSGERPDGVPVSAGGPVPAAHETWVLRDFTGGAGPDRIPGKDFEDEPLIAVLTSPFAGRAGDVRAGEALQRVLLTATADGLTASFLSQLVEVPDTREAVRRLVGALRPPQAVLRMPGGCRPATGRVQRPVPDRASAPALDGGSGATVLPTLGKDDMTMNTMLAAVVPTLGAPLEIRELPVPEPGPGQVLVRMQASGICHTDIHAARGDWPVKPRPPFIPGHEGVGIVVAQGRKLEEITECFEDVLGGRVPARLVIEF